MPMQVTQGQPIAHHLQPNNNQRTAAQAVINLLQYTDLWRGPGKLRTSPDESMRVDMQGTIPGPPVRHNIQVQVNDMHGNSTVAHADVSTSLMTSDANNQRGVLRRVISALNQSLDDGHTYTVTGTSP
jgi:hypothetical protein